MPMLKSKLNTKHLQMVLIHLEEMIKEVEDNAKIAAEECIWPMYHVHPELLDGLNAAHYCVVKVRQTVEIASGH